MLPLNRTSLKDIEVQNNGVGFTQHVQNGNLIWYKAGLGKVIVEDKRNDTYFTMMPGDCIEVAEYHKLNFYCDYGDKKIFCLGYGKPYKLNECTYQNNQYMCGHTVYGTVSEYSSMGIANPVDSKIIIEIDGFKLGGTSSAESFYMYLTTETAPNSITNIINCLTGEQNGAGLITCGTLASTSMTGKMFYNGRVRYMNNNPVLENGYPLILNPGYSIIAVNLLTDHTMTGLFNWKEYNI